MKRKEKDTYKNLSKSELEKVLADTQTAIVQSAVHRRITQTRNSREIRVLHQKQSILSSFLREKEIIHENTK